MKFMNTGKLHHLAGAGLGVLFLLTHPCWAQQNLVPNSSFEQHKGLPTEIGQFNLAAPWNTFAPGNQPADYFHRQSSRPRTALPVNFIGTQQARSGDAYAGILVYLNSKEAYAEFIQVHLTAPLEAGRTYFAGMHVSLADNSRFAVDGLDILVSERAPLLAQGAFAEYTPQIRNPTKALITDKDNWVQVGGTFVAQGGERVLTIGNFRPRAKTAAKRVKSDRKERDPYDYAYYYVDDVEVKLAVGEPGDTPAVVAETPTPYFNEAEFTKPVVLRNVVFAVDEAQLLPESVEELRHLHTLLLDRPQLVIFLTGHTDNTHTPAYNLQLSEARVRAVKDWLVEQGIAPDRLRTKGYGDTRPVADNRTEEGRRTNRRVEFSVLGQ